jgi:hypothetical protein
MKRITLVLSVVTLHSVLAAPAALARADCASHPQSEWISEAEMKKRLVEQGYEIKKFKIDGNCYEIYGKNKDGKKVEIYFDTKTGDIVKSRIR